MREIKRVFLFIKRVKGNEKIIKKVCAVSEDEKHKFEFELCQTDYAESIGKLKAEFENFCVCECGFDNSVYCDVWTLDDELIEWLDYENSICLWLGSVHWCCYQSVEFNYKNKNAHIQNPLSFVELKAAHCYDESNEPLETKRIYEIYKNEIDKVEFSEQDVKNMAKFLSAKRYAAFFEAISNNYPMRIKLRETLCNLYIANKAEYEKQVKGLSDEIISKITVMLGRFADIFSELPTIYHERCDYDDWVAYERDEKNNDIPIYLHKHFDIIPEGVMKNIIYAMTAQKESNDNSSKEKISAFASLISIMRI